VLVGILGDHTIGPIGNISNSVTAITVLLPAA
jgi:hypothetical protein